jgi:hypothetical protein
MKSKGDAVCEIIKSTDIAKGVCDSQLRDGMYIHYGEKNTVLGGDFAAWLRVQPTSNTLLIKGKTPQGIFNQHIQVLINDQVVHEYQVKRQDESFALRVDIASYQNNGVIKIRLQSSESVTPLYHRNLIGQGNDPQSLILHSIEQE